MDRLHLNVGLEDLARTAEPRVWSSGVAVFEKLEGRWRATGGLGERLSAIVHRHARSDAADIPLNVDGAFAYAVCRDGGLTAGCDLLGKSTMFYSSVSGGGLSLSTDLGDLCQKHPQIDEAYVEDFLATGVRSETLTPYVGISRLSPGQALRWDGSLRCEDVLSGWSPVPEPWDRDDPAAALRERLDFVVAGAMLGGGRVGCELSGGLDSSTVYRIARRLHGADIPSFSYVFPQSEQADERPFILAALGGDTTSWSPIDGDLDAAFTAEPSGCSPEPSLALIYAGRIEALERAVERAGVETVLTGVGGDSALFGDSPAPVYLADLIANGRWRQAWRDARRWRSEADTARPTSFWLTSAGVRPLFRWWARTSLQDREPWPSWYERDWIAHSRLTRRRRARAVHHPRGVAVSDQLAAVQREGRSLASLYSAHAGVAFRHPLMSLPLLEFMITLPDSLKVSPACDRLLHRHAIKDVVPETVRMRRSKGGVDQSIFAGLRRSVHWRQRLCDDPILARRGYIDRDRWRDAVKAFAAGHCQSIRLFHATAVLETWFQERDRRSQREASAGTSP
jgi:asparagine synthase (glutamine-hydrolysing)